MIQDDVINNLRMASKQNQLGNQEKVKRRRKIKYTIILQNEAREVKDIMRQEIFVLGQEILDSESGVTGKIVRIEK